MLETHEEMGMDRLKSIAVLTTFHKEGYDLYGKRFLESWCDKVDNKIALMVYAENCAPPVNEDHYFLYFSETELTKLNEFKQRWKDDPKANGIPPDDIKARRPRDWHKKFKWDAVRFANKTYAVFEAARRWQKMRDGEWLCWLDADTYVHSPLTHEQLSELLPADKWLTYVGRGKGSQTWPECGFYGMNIKHPTCQKFLEEFERYYDDANNGIFTLEEWHDSFVFGHLLNKFKEQDPNVLDYSAEMYLREAKTGGGGHPLINGPLGKYFDHMKGGRKEKGKSERKDIMVNRTEAYWNEI